MKKRSLYLSVGRCASGKDTLVGKVREKTGWKRVISFTDAPIRADQTEGIEHYFLTSREMDELLKTQTVIAYTKIGQYRYCATMESLDDNTMFYVIDPNGIKYLRENYGDTLNLVTMYINVPESVRRERMKKTRPGFNADIRIKSEDEQFNAFEEEMAWDICYDNTSNLNDVAEQLIHDIDSIEKSRNKAS